MEPKFLCCHAGAIKLYSTVQVPSGTFIYMTFDDGPNEGTPYVLDALKEVRRVEDERDVILRF